MTAFILTEHAAQVMTERGIEQRWVEVAFDAPLRLEPDAADPDLLHRIARIDDAGGRVLRVVASRDEPFRVVTAFFDRRLRTQTL